MTSNCNARGNVLPLLALPVGAKQGREGVEVDSALQEIHGDLKGLIFSFVDGDPTFLCKSLSAFKKTSREFASDEALLAMVPNLFRAVTFHSLNTALARAFMASTVDLRRIGVICTAEQQVVKAIEVAKNTFADSFYGRRIELTFEDAYRNGDIHGGIAQWGLLRRAGIPGLMRHPVTLRKELRRMDAYGKLRHDFGEGRAWPAYGSTDGLARWLSMHTNGILFSEELVLSELVEAAQAYIYFALRDRHSKILMLHSHVMGGMQDSSFLKTCLDKARIDALADVGFRPGFRPPSGDVRPGEASALRDTMQHAFNAEEAQQLFDKFKDANVGTRVKDDIDVMDELIFFTEQRESEAGAAIYTEKSGILDFLIRVKLTFHDHRWEMMLRSSPKELNEADDTRFPQIRATIAWLERHNPISLDLRTFRIHVAAFARRDNFELAMKSPPGAAR